MVSTQIAGFSFFQTLTAWSSRSPPRLSYQQPRASLGLAAYAGGEPTGLEFVLVGRSRGSLGEGCAFYPTELHPPPGLLLSQQRPALCPQIHQPGEVTPTTKNGPNDTDDPVSFSQMKSEILRTGSSTPELLYEHDLLLFPPAAKQERQARCSIIIIDDRPKSSKQGYLSTTPAEQSQENNLKVIVNQ